MRQVLTLWRRGAYAWLFGDDDDEFFDIAAYERVPAGRWSLADRFIYKLAMRTVWRVRSWMWKWDSRFNMRYFDLKRARHPERYIQ